MRRTRKENKGTKNLHRATSMKLKFIPVELCSFCLRPRNQLTHPPRQLLNIFDQLPSRQRHVDLLVPIFTLCSLPRAPAIVSHNNIYHPLMCMCKDSEACPISRRVSLSPRPVRDRVTRMALRISIIQVVHHTELGAPICTQYSQPRMNLAW